MGATCSAPCCTPGSQEFLEEVPRQRPRPQSGDDRLFGDFSPDEPRKGREPEHSPGSASTRAPTSSDSWPNSEPGQPLSEAWVECDRQQPEPIAAEPGASGVGEDCENEASLRALLREVRELCRQGRIFDAMEALKSLEQEVAARAARPGTATVKAELLRDTAVAELRRTHGRMHSVLSTMGPEALPTGENDKRWERTTIKDPQIDPAFLADIRIRFAVGGERNPDGPSAQLIICGVLSRFPLSVERMVSLYRETDLYRKEWLSDCECCEGTVGGEEKSYSAMSHIVNASPILPMRLDILTLRDFAVCPENSPVGERGPGVLVVDASPPSDKSSCSGWDFPAQAHRSTRLSNVCLVMYFTPSPGYPNYCDAFVIGKVGAPVPQWLLPLSLLKRFLANHYISVFRSAKRHIVDDWEALAYERRVACCPGFYESAAAVKNP